MGTLESSVAPVRCRWCRLPIRIAGKRLCSSCSDLYMRIRMEPDLARRMLEEVEQSKK